MYKKITAEADKEVSIKKHPLKRKIILTNIFVEKKGEQEKEPEDNITVNSGTVRRSTCVLGKKKTILIIRKKKKKTNLKLELLKRHNIIM